MISAFYKGDQGVASGRVVLVKPLSAESHGLEATPMILHLGSSNSPSISATYRDRHNIEVKSYVQRWASAS